MVTIGISSLQVTPDNYGYMGPIKAALESCARFLAKSFSADSAVRFNVVGAGPLRTSSSAGIPGYLESYLYAEKLTFRKRALATAEVANAALFLLSERSSGMNGATMVVDAGLAAAPLLVEQFVHGMTRCVAAHESSLGEPDRS